MRVLDIDQLQTFLAIVETESFTRAADKVAKTQSAVSMQMKKLEETLGKKLFVREGRGVTVNADGQRLVGYARDIVEKSGETLAAFDKNALRGSISLGTADDYAERFLPAILAGFSQSNPLVEVSVVCENTFGLAQRIQTGELDVAIVTHNETRLHSELIRQEPLLWVTSKNHAVHTDDPLPLALGSPHCIWRKSAIDALDEIGRSYRMLYTSFSATVVGSAVTAGLAVSVQPESALRPGMRVLTERDGFPTLPNCEIGLLRGTREKSDATEALVAHIRHSLNAMAAPECDLDEVVVDIETIGRPPKPQKRKEKPLLEPAVCGW